MKFARGLFHVGLLVQILLVCSVPGIAVAEELWLEAPGSEPLVDLHLPSFSPVVEKLGKAVVNISIEGREKLPESQGPGQIFKFPGQNELPFEFYFESPNGPGAQKGRPFTSLGSGFVIHPDGYIVTNNHVVDKATRILVSFKDDKKKYEAEIIGRDEKTDIALLKLKTAPSKVESVVLGDSDALSEGDWVIAIGNPFRFGHTATVGIVSAKSRRIPGGGPYDDYIQTDASINPGNSGGPLFNARGEVIGVNTAIFSPGGRLGQSGFNVGIGFAIPVNMVKNILNQLHEKGRVTRGWLGVLIQSVSDDVAQAMELDEATGALVADVIDDSPAVEAGFKRGDVIVEYDGQQVSDNSDLPLMVANTPIGKKVNVEIVRKGNRKVLEVTIAELRDEGSSPVEGNEAQSQESRLGITIQELSSDIVSSMGIDEEVKGVIIARVEPDSPAAIAGLRPADIILEVDGQEVTSITEFVKAAKSMETGKPVLLLVQRGENSIFLTIRLEE